jgi:hypothetical protein
MWVSAHMNSLRHRLRKEQEQDLQQTTRLSTESKLTSVWLLAIHRRRN